MAIVKPGVLIFALAMLSAKCASSTPTPQSVYQALVDANCLAPDDAGPAAIEQEHASTNQPAWMACLFDGGSVQSCKVPCRQ